MIDGCLQFEPRCIHTGQEVFFAGTRGCSARTHTHRLKVGYHIFSGSGEHNWSFERRRLDQAIGFKSISITSSIVFDNMFLYYAKCFFNFIHL